MSNTLTAEEVDTRLDHYLLILHRAIYPRSLPGLPSCYFYRFYMYELPLPEDLSYAFRCTHWMLWRYPLMVKDYSEEQKREVLSVMKGVLHKLCERSVKV